MGIDTALHNESLAVPLLQNAFPLVKMPKLKDVPLDKTICEEEYKRELPAAARESWGSCTTGCTGSGCRWSSCYEGWDAAGKGRQHQAADGGPGPPGV